MKGVASLCKSQNFSEAAHGKSVDYVMTICDDKMTGTL